MVADMARKDGGKAVTIIFRIAALILVVAATVVMGTARDLVVLDDHGGRKWSSYYVVSYNHYSSLMYFVVAGVIAAVCSAAGLFLIAVNANPVGAGALVPLLDVLAQGFLFSAAGAAFATRSNAPPANTWAGNGGRGGGGTVCDAGGAFCGKVTIAATVGTVAAVAVTVAAVASKDGARRSLRRCCDF